MVSYCALAFAWGGLSPGLFEDGTVLELDTTRFGLLEASSISLTMCFLSFSLSSPSSCQYITALEQWWGARSTFQARSSALLTSKMRFDDGVGEISE